MHLSVERFFHSLILNQDLIDIRQYNKSLTFSDNSATVDDPDLFGGWLDRCIPSPFAACDKINVNTCRCGTLA